jgi:rhodanese-related sulfurtransferase
MAGMETITPIKLHQLLAARPSVPLIDVRTPMEFAEVHVPLAHNIPLDELKPGSLSLPKDQPVYLLCRGGQRATNAAQKFAREGFAQPVVVEGGTQAWIAANLPLERSAVRVISLERQVRIVAGSLVLIGIILGWFVHRGFFGLSAFVGAGLVFAGVTDFCGMGLLLARLPWNKRPS